MGKSNFVGEMNVSLPHVLLRSVCSVRQQQSQIHATACAENNYYLIQSIYKNAFKSRPVSDLSE